MLESAGDGEHLESRKDATGRIETCSTACCRSGWVWRQQRWGGIPWASLHRCGAPDCAVAPWPAGAWTLRPTRTRPEGTMLQSASAACWEKLHGASWPMSMCSTSSMPV
eukprot:scaffold7502_cov112-Isochrysis_galbana.AAC.5